MDDLLSDSFKRDEVEWSAVQFIKYGAGALMQRRYARELWKKNMEVNYGKFGEMYE